MATSSLPFLFPAIRADIANLLQEHAAVRQEERGTRLGAPASTRFNVPGITTPTSPLTQLLIEN